MEFASKNMTNLLDFVFERYVKDINQSSQNSIEYNLDFFVANVMSEKLKITTTPFLADKLKDSNSVALHAESIEGELHETLKRIIAEIAHIFVASDFTKENGIAFTNSKEGEGGGRIVLTIKASPYYKNAQTFSGWIRMVISRSHLSK